MPNLPNFNDLPDGSSSIIHTGENLWVEIDLDEEMSFSAEPAPAVPPPPLNLGAPPPNPVGYSSQFPPHPSYADGSVPLMPPPITNGSHNTAIGASALSQRQGPSSDPTRRTATEIAQAEQAVRINPASARINPAWRTTPIDLSSQVCDPSPPRRPRRRREISDPDAAIRKDPNAWSLREAVELCKLLEVVLPEAGFHIALTGDLLYKEGKQRDCGLLFYQIRGTEPNHEILWKYLVVAGVIRSPSYPENGWLVKATYRGKAVDCLFPNAKKAKKAGAANPDCYKAAPPAPSTPPNLNTAVGSVAYPIPPPIPPPEGCVVVRHDDGAPIIYRRTPYPPYPSAELIATPAPAPVPVVAQWEEPF